MLIIAITEPRSGSENLAKWFKVCQKIETLHSPMNKRSYQYQKNLIIEKYKGTNNHLFIKEDFAPEHDYYNKEIEIADKLIFLWRKNTKDQIESWIMATRNNNFLYDYIYIEKNDDKTKQINYFNWLKNRYKELYLNKEISNSFKISYEELYYRDGINQLINYLNYGINTNGFSFGHKYRQTISKLI